MNKRSIAPRAGLVSGVVLAAAAELVLPAVAHATEAESVTLEEDSSSPAAKPAEKDKDKDKDKEEPTIKRVVAPYSLPWQLRPVLPMTMARLDNSFAFYGVNGTTIVNDLSVSYRIIPRIAVLVHIATAGSSPPPATPGGGSFGFVNPLIGAQAGFWPVKGLKIGAFLGFTLPLGMGGGTDPNQGSVNTNYAAMLARSGFDNPLFMPDYFAIWPGLDVAYVTHGFTAQFEMSLPIMNKVRGPQTEKLSNVDMTIGLHAGYFIFDWWSAGLDFRYERWLTDSAIVKTDPTGEIRDLATIEPGVRFHVPINENVMFRPGLAMAFGLDQPMAGSNYKILRLDLPFTF
jgi:hypothetical protein